MKFIIKVMLIFYILLLILTSFISVNASLHSQLGCSYPAPAQSFFQPPPDYQPQSSPASSFTFFQGGRFDSSARMLRNSNN